DSTTPGISPPKGIENPDLKVGFSDVVEDTDGVIRRNLLLSQESNDCPTQYSLGLQLALKYLEAENIQAKFDAREGLQIGNVKFKPLTSNSGAYQNMDAGGEQILFKYRNSNQVAEKVSATDILRNKDDRELEDLVKDRVVLIGYTAPSLKDIFNTPYSSGKSDLSGGMAGVEIHANSVSQILSTVLNGEKLFWFLPESGEAFWIFLWTLPGGFIGTQAFKDRKNSIIAGLGFPTVLIVGNLIIFFTLSGWIPVVTPALGFILAAGSVIGVNGYIEWEERRKEDQIYKDQLQAKNSKES
ncbi:MAG: CHASE2 domain-containing protein, partial [Rivularia sp. (in: cyanobacteria)]